MFLTFYVHYNSQFIQPLFMNAVHSKLSRFCTYTKTFHNKMLRLAILTIVVFIASVSLAHAVLFDRDPTESFAATKIVEHPLNKQWEAFKNRFSKVYRDGQHELKRRLVWETNWMKIRLHNAEYERGLHTFHLAMNHLGDLTAAEVKSAMNGFRMDMVRARAARANRKTFTPSAAQLENLPSSVDWRNVSNVITNVKNQGMCGSCWAFSATGSLEGQHALKSNGSLVSLSEQNLVDCSKPEGNEGCNGGLMDQAFEYVRKNGGIDSEAAYPYRGIWSFGKCKFKTDKIGATVRNFTDIPAGNETALTAAVANVGPISVAIDASDFTFQFYFGGVYHSSSCSSTELDHGVLVVGYGSEGPSKDYYIVKNSWGRFWGKKGYILMSRNRGNNCGIASQASYPDV